MVKPVGNPELVILILNNFLTICKYDQKSILFEHLMNIKWFEKYLTQENSNEPV